MSRIGSCFERLRARGERALVPFVTAGDPTSAPPRRSCSPWRARGGPDRARRPFSDPIAEGPTIQRRASARSPGHEPAPGARAREAAARAHRGAAAPHGLREPLLRDGRARCAEAAAAAGVDGIIVPDLPPEEGADLYGARPTPASTPCSSRPDDDRRAPPLLAERTRGFLYYVSLTGVTGPAPPSPRTSRRRRAREGPLRRPRLRRLRRLDPDHAREIARFADGVVVAARSSSASSAPAPPTRRWTRSPASSRS